MTSDLIGLLVAALVLCAGFGLLIGMKKVMGSFEGGTFIALLTVPLIAYALTSGRVKEFSGPGGLTVKFSETAKASVLTAAIAEDAIDVQRVEKGPAAAIPELVAKLKPDLPNALVLRVGRRGYYVPSVMRSYLRALMTVGPASYVLFVANDSGKFIGSAAASQVFAALSEESAIDRFMSELEAGGPEPFADYDFIVRASLRPGDSNTDALDKFLTTNAETLVLVSDDGKKVLGVVQRSRLVTKLMLQLAKGSS